MESPKKIISPVHSRGQEGPEWFDLNLETVAASLTVAPLFS